MRHNLRCAHRDIRDADGSAEAVLRSAEARGRGAAAAVVVGVGGLDVAAVEEAGEEAGEEGFDGWEGGADYAGVDFNGGPGCGADVVPWCWERLVGLGNGRVGFFGRELTGEDGCADGPDAGGDHDGEEGPTGAADRAPGEDAEVLEEDGDFCE
ncbi:hypothetical protein FGG08_000520, partial [Glutinoglossum americanum]